MLGDDSMHSLDKILFKSTPLSEYWGMMSGLMKPYDLEGVPEELITLLHTIEDSISPLIRSDLDYFNTKLHFYNIPKYYVTNNGMESIDDFMNEISRLSPEDLWQLILKAIFSLPLDATDRQVVERIEQDDFLASFNYQAEAILEFKAKIDDLLPRVVLFFKQLYNVVFKAVEKELMAFARKQRSLLEKEYRENPEAFVNNYIKVNTEEFLNNPAYKAVFYVGASNYDQLTFTIPEDKPEEMFVKFGYLVARYLKEESSEELVKSVGESTKLSMIKLLAKESMYASQLAEALSLNRATISHHILQLIKLGVIKVDYSEGKRVYYGLNLTTIREGFRLFIESLERRGQAHE